MAWGRPEPRTAWARHSPTARRSLQSCSPEFRSGRTCAARQRRLAAVAVAAVLVLLAALGVPPACSAPGPCRGDLLKPGGRSLGSVLIDMADATTVILLADKAFRLGGKRSSLLATSHQPSRPASPNDSRPAAGERRPRDQAAVVAAFRIGFRPSRASTPVSPTGRCCRGR